jgi:hypothetical protein
MIVASYVGVNSVVRYQDKKPCTRCGRPHVVRNQAPDRSHFCMDCRQTDSWLVNKVRKAERDRASRRSAQPGVPRTGLSLVEENV